MSAKMRNALIYIGEVRHYAIRLPSSFFILIRPIIFNVCRDIQVRDQKRSGITMITGKRTILQISLVPSYLAKSGVHRQ
ncbi:MAG: hypothetical protein ABSE07_01575 [Methanoregula sp.]|jgi:hypothetical protein